MSSSKTISMQLYKETDEKSKIDLKWVYFIANPAELNLKDHVLHIDKTANEIKNLLKTEYNSINFFRGVGTLNDFNSIEYEQLNYIYEVFKRIDSTELAKVKFINFADHPIFKKDSTENSNKLNKIVKLLPNLESIGLQGTGIYENNPHSFPTLVDNICKDKKKP